MEPCRLLRPPPTSVFENLLAGLTLAACLALLLRLAVGARRRARLDAALARAWRALHRTGSTTLRWPGARRRAALEARDAIERARRRGAWEGNVYRPDSFRKRERKDH